MLNLGAATRNQGWLMIEERGLGVQHLSSKKEGVQQTLSMIGWRLLSLLLVVVLALIFDEQDSLLR